MKLPNLVEINLLGNAVSRKQLYRIGVVKRFPHIIVVDCKEVSNEEKQRAHAFYLEQCIIREDPVAKVINLSQSLTLGSKNSLKIRSVVLDGLEMKLSATGFGVGGRS